MSASPSRRRRITALALAIALSASACGSVEVDNDVSAAAETSAAALDHSDSIAATELIDARTGEVATLADVATGDRPLLVWYWAPH